MMKSQKLKVKKKISFKDKIIERPFQFSSMIDDIASEKTCKKVKSVKSLCQVVYEDDDEEYQLDDHYKSKQSISSTLTGDTSQ